MKIIFAKKAVSRDSLSRMEGYFNKLFRCLSRDPFIGIKYEDPFIPTLIHRKLFLSRVSPPFFNDDFATGGSGHGNRVVHASAIDDHDFIREGKTFQARSDPVFLIFVIMATETGTPVSWLGVMHLWVALPVCFHLPGESSRIVPALQFRIFHSEQVI